jgi:rhamnose transport system ATP-binding protein
VAGQTTGELLRLASIRKSFGAVRALRGVSFDLQAREVHALLGENGAGKSTLIRIISGAHAPDSGTITLGGQPISHLSPTTARQLGVACIYQQPALFPDLSVAENLALRLESAQAFRRVAWPERRQRAADLLHRIGANISPDTEAGQLSMPEQQLVEIACAVGAKARIVIMDEPTSSLTRAEQELLFGVVRELRRSGVGVVYISHRLDEIFALADRVTVLRDGESVGTCAASELDEAALIKLMVGREIDQVYPPAEGGCGRVVLALQNLACAASGIRDVSLEVHAGEVVGLAGLVGAGRTELARTIFGITPCDSGAVLLNGEKVLIHSPQDAIAHGIAYVPEDRRRHGVILEMPVAANITMAIHRRLFPATWLRAGAEQALAQGFVRDLDIRAPDLEAPAMQLSGGNQQKVSLARWLATNPRLLILDEPTQGVDVGAKSEIHRIIRRLAKAGVAVLMISSDLPEILGMSNRIAVMRGGTIVAQFQGRSSAHEVMGASLGQGASVP